MIGADHPVNLGRPEETFRNECYERLLPEYVSPAVAHPTHDSCPLNGEVLVCVGGRVMRLAVVGSRGIVRDAIPLTVPEHVPGAGAGRS